MLSGPVEIDIVVWQARELRMETVFRYANIFDRAITLIASGKINMTPLIAKIYDFSNAIIAFDRPAQARPDDVKIQINMTGAR